MGDSALKKGWITPVTCQFDVLLSPILVLVLCSMFFDPFDPLITSLILPTNSLALVLVQKLRERQQGIQSKPKHSRSPLYSTARCLCGSTDKIEVHHIRKLADLEQKGKSERPDWMKKMAARHRKTLVVCLECHHKIQYGRYDGKALSR